MMNLPSISPETIARIARGAVSLEQHYYYHTKGWSDHYCIRVAYPNGYGASIIAMSADPGEFTWEVGLLKDGKLYYDEEGCDCIWSDLKEDDIAAICDRIYFY